MMARRKKDAKGVWKRTGAKNSNSVKSVDLMSQLAMNIALWTAPGRDQEPDAFLHQLSVESADEHVSTHFSHVCQDLEEVYSFSFMFLKTIIEDSKPKRVLQHVDSGILEITIEDAVTIRMSFVSVS